MAENPGEGFMCIYVCGYAHECRFLWGQKASRPVEGELQIVLGTKSESHVRAESALNGRTISPVFPLLGIFLKWQKDNKTHWQSYYRTPFFQLKMKVISMVTSMAPGPKCIWISEDICKCMFLMFPQYLWYRFYFIHLTLKGTEAPTEPFPAVIRVSNTPEIYTWTNSAQRGSKFHGGLPRK